MVSSSTHCRRFAIIAAFFVAAWNVHVGLNNQLLFYSTSSSSWGGKDVDDMPPAAQQQQQQQQWTAYYTSKKNDTPVEERARSDNNRQRPIHNSNQASTAPLFYHVSPGSTGSRSLYFATCHAGFPSVHYLSYCIANDDHKATGADGRKASDDVIRGLLAHYEIMKLYNTAVECCIHVQRQQRLMQNSSTNNYKDGEIKHNHHHTFVVLNKDSSVEQIQQICHANMNMLTWVTNLQIQLEIVIRSGMVGLFDTPYPLLASQIINMSQLWRSTPIIISMTERQPKEWSDSRIQNHEMLLCKEEYSYNQLGASEFDLMGCYERAVIAHNNNNNNNNNNNTDIIKGGGSSSNIVLHFEDVFYYHYHKQEDDVVDVKSLTAVAILRRGMERQMQHHQELYLPLTTYSPDIFNVHSSTTTMKKKITEADMSKDIRKHILGITTTTNDNGNNNNDEYDNDEIETKANNNSRGNVLHARVAPFDYGNFYKLNMNWTEAYLKPLALKTCTGRIVKCLII